MFKRLFGRPVPQVNDDRAQAVDCIAGPVEQIGSDLVLRIPLHEGGNKLIDCTRGIGRIEGDSLEIIFPAWLVEKTGLTDGAKVVVGNQGGKFALWRTDDGEAPPRSVAP